MDRAGGHTTGKLQVPKNITIILLPSRSPEPNPVQNIWRAGIGSPTASSQPMALSSMPGLQQADRSTRNKHLNRHEKMGLHRLKINAARIRL